MRDFFISYTGVDRPWAEWIAWHLEQVGFSTIIQARDFHAGGNFILEMHRAAKGASRTIAVLSSKYQEAMYTQPEWSSALVDDPTGQERLLVPIRIEDIEPEGLLKPLIYIDLVGLAEARAKEHLINEIQKTVGAVPSRPQTAPTFPSSAQTAPRLPGSFPDKWNLPRRNPNFTGRIQMLEEMRKSLTKSRHTALTQQVMYGLGGIGKSQLALEYAYQYCSSYDLIWWLHAETPASLVADYIALAAELKLSEQQEQEQEKIVRAVRKWFDHHQGWLLIFDNAQDAKSIQEYLPESPDGHVLITSRNQNWGAFGTSLPVEVWDRSESFAFLKKRTGQSDEAAADDLAKALGYLPLALEQAASYIDTRQLPYADYLALFTSRRKALWEREHAPEGYSDTVATTWSLAFDEIKQVTLAKELLYLCSIVAPDGIPKTLLRKALHHFLNNGENIVKVDGFEFDDALVALSKYSLITHDPRTVSMHRLVQTVVQDRMGEEDISSSYHNAMIVALSELFPEKPYRNPDCWSDCAKVSPHAQKALSYVHDDQDRDWAARSLLLNNIGEYHTGRGSFDEAEKLLGAALQIREKTLEADHPDVAYSMNNCAVLHMEKGLYDEAEPLYRRALEIREKKLGPDHPDVANSLNNFANLLYKKGLYDEAEPLYRQALEIREKKLGSDHPDISDSLNGLANLLTEKGLYDEAEPLYRRALEIREKKLGPDHPDVANILNNLANLLTEKGGYDEAEPLLRRALEIREKKLGPDHPDLSDSLNSLASILYDKDRYGQAEPLLRRALEIREKKLGPDHPDVVNILNNLATLLKARKKFQEAQLYYRKALSVYERTYGKNHPKTVALRKESGLSNKRRKKKRR